MFSQLISSQIHDLHATSVEQSDLSDQQQKNNSLPHISHKAAADTKQHRRSTSNLSDSGGKFFCQLSSKYSSQLIDKFIRSDLLNSSYDSLKCQKATSTPLYSNLHVSDRRGFDCLQGSYRNHGDGEIYEVGQVKQQVIKNSNEGQESCKLTYHRNLTEHSMQATLKTHTSDAYPARRGRGLGFRSQNQSMEPKKDNNNQPFRCTHSSGSGSGSEVQRSSSGSSSSGTGRGGGGDVKILPTIPSPERLYRRRLLHMISGYDLQNKQLQCELAKEKRRRINELACVVKSLMLLEAKLKNDLMSVNQRMLDKDAEICRLTRLTRTLRKRLKDQQCGESMVAEHPDCDKVIVLKALQCNNCRKEFYDIGIRANKEVLSACDKAEMSSSSDDTLSSSFCGVRRSARYTSKRTAGTFRDYMSSRAMHIEDRALEQHSEENTSSVSLEDSQTSYEHLHKYARAMERIHGVKMSPEDVEYSEQSSLELEQGKTTGRSCVTVHLEEDDVILSHLQEGDEIDNELNSDQEQMMLQGSIQIIQRRFADFSEASPKQIYETTTDDWYASASDQEESSPVASKPYSRGAVNPVLECVNQILLQQSMEETMVDPVPKSALANRSTSNGNSPNRSSLVGRTVSNRRKRVHFSTKNSMVHVPRHNDQEAQERRQIQISNYRDRVANITGDAFNYGSIYSNEYEPIGSERASNLYVDMAASSTANSGEEIVSSGALKPSMKLPPALPPKPANLLKFQKSLHQFVEGQQAENDCGASITTASEPDYCSISEVGMTRTFVQIVVDVHKAPESNSPPALEQKMHLEIQQNQKVRKANNSDDNHSEKTIEIEEVFADIPKLPNVAAIIAPKQSEPDNLMIGTKSAMLLQRPSQAAHQPLSLSTFQYKRKHVPNILAEINKRMSLPSSPNTTKSLPSTPVSKFVLKTMTSSSSEMPIQAEFDWYNLDAEFDRSHQLGKDPDTPVTADEYNLDEEFQKEEHSMLDPKMEDIANALRKSHLEPAKTKKMVLNLANFEKFIEGSGLTTKPLPCKRRINLNAPIV